MRHVLFVLLVGGYVIVAVGLGLLVGLAGLHDYLRSRWRQHLARQLAPFLADERSRHAADLAEARRQHREAQLWLMETHRDELDRAVAEALTSVAPDPMRRAS
jgi:hypothetical protein